MVQAEARGAWPWALGPLAPPMARSGTLEEAPDFTTLASHSREQMARGIGG